MSSYNARVLGTDPDLIAQELERVGAQGPGQRIMWNKAAFLPVRLERLSCVAANVLKQEMLARGGDCAVHRDCVTLEREETAVLLLGTRAQYGDLLEKLRRQGFGLPGAADQIDELLVSLDAPRTPVQLGPYTLPLGERTLVMGIINVTPDSFSGDSLGDDVDAAVAQARRMHAEGADILDVGGQSTRPGSDPVPVEEEVRRVLPVIERLAAADGVPLPLSVDTNRAAVAEAGLQAGAHIVNDITGLRDEPELAEVAARRGAGLVLMHIQGTPRTMQQNPHYDDLLGEVIAYLREGAGKALAAGVPRERIWVDPGIGFGKTLEHNLELLRRLAELRSLGCAVLVGTSRKSFIGRILAETRGGEAPPPGERVVGTGATLAVAVANGADIVRVHDVAHAVEVVRVADAIVRRSHPFERLNAQTLAYLGLGSNLGDREAHLEAAIDAIDRLPNTTVLRRSRLYGTRPWGRTDQPDYLNMVIEVSTGMDPRDLLREVKRIEGEQGRVPGERWGPRTVDIDILLVGDTRIDTPVLTVPHPRMWERAFVLRPLADLRQDLQGPDGASIGEWLEREDIDTQGVWSH